MYLNSTSSLNEGQIRMELIVKVHKPVMLLATPNYRVIQKAGK